MNSRKRQASDPLLPLRSSKVIRTTDPDLLPTSRWLDHIVKLGRETLSYFTLVVQGKSDSDARIRTCTSNTSTSENDSQPVGFSSPYPPSSRFRTPDAQLTPGESSRCHRSLAPPPSTPAVTRKRHPTPPTSPTRARQRRSHSPNPLTFLPPPPLPIMSSTLRLPPPVPSSSLKPIRPENGNTQRSYSSGESLLSPSQPPNHIYPHSQPASESIQASPPSFSQTSTIPSGRSDPMLTTHSAATLSTAVTSSTTAKDFTHPSSVNGSQHSIAQTLDSAMRIHRSKDSFYGIPRSYQNKEHIYAKQVRAYRLRFITEMHIIHHFQHKTAILTQQKKDREDMIKELYQLKRSVGMHPSLSRITP